MFRVISGLRYGVERPSTYVSMRNVTVCGMLVDFRLM
jgi:hypothetical protein